MYLSGDSCQANRARHAVPLQTEQLQAPDTDARTTHAVPLRTQRLWAKRASPLRTEQPHELHGPVPAWAPVHCFTKTCTAVLGRFGVTMELNTAAGEAMLLLTRLSRTPIASIWERSTQVDYARGSAT